MNATTISVDLAKSVFQIAVANDKWEVIESHRLTRSQFERWFANRAVRRDFASWFGLTPKEYSSGSTRRLGRISKRGDKYLRMLLTHGARASLGAATVSLQAGRQIDTLRQWALQVQQRACHNKAACALANKMARICYAVLRDGVPYESNTISEQRKMNRATFVTAH